MPAPKSKNAPGDKPRENRFRVVSHMHSRLTHGSSQPDQIVGCAQDRTLHVFLFVPSRGEWHNIHPQNPILTAWGKPELELQKTGHASWVETQDGEWYMAHLCGRPLEPIGNRGYCNLGRETALQKLEWGTDGWPRLVGGGKIPRAPACPLRSSQRTIGRSSLFVMISTRAPLAFTGRRCVNPPTRVGCH